MLGFRIMIRSLGFLDVGQSPNWLGLMKTKSKMFRSIFVPELEKFHYTEIEYCPCTVMKKSEICSRHTRLHLLKHLISADFHFFFLPFSNHISNFQELRKKKNASNLFQNPNPSTLPPSSQHFFFKKTSHQFNE